MSKLDCPVWQTGVSFQQKISELLDKCNKGFKVALDKHLSKNESTKRQSRTKQVKPSIKLATLAVTKVTLVRIVLKLKFSFIRLSMII
jgi:hypothetical protein